MKHTLNFIKKKLHNSKLCRNFLLILTVATLCVSALCIPISAENPLTDKTETYYGFWLSDNISEMERASNENKELYNSFLNPQYLPSKCIITNSLNEDYRNGEIIIPVSSIIFKTATTALTPDVYVEIDNNTYCIWNAENTSNHNETVIYFLYETMQEAETACEAIFKETDSSIYTNISYDEFIIEQQGILSIFGNVGNWITNAVNNITAMFWQNGSLSFIGVLVVGGLSISIVLLIIRLISSFLAFRG